MEREQFEAIRTRFCEQYIDVHKGKMMHAPALLYKTKVFAFLSSTNEMVFKLGKDYPIEKMKIVVKEFNPFKNKGPLKGWYTVPYNNDTIWRFLTAISLEKISTL